MEGFVIGTVVADWDEEHQGMVQAKFLPGPDEEVITEWIPVMIPFGGGSYGSCHLPGVGNTVVIGFEYGNGNRPMVMGCLWSQDNPIPPKHLWKSKTGYSFSLDEEEKHMAWTDPEGKNSIVWSTKEKTLIMDVEETLVLKIGGEKFLTLKKDKLTVHVALNVKADKIIVSAESIETDTSENTTLKGKNIKLSSEQKLNVEGTTLELKATASGKFGSSGILELKGAMIKLN